MVTYDQIPLYRVSAKRALARGNINLHKYNEIIRVLDQLEQEHRALEKQTHKKIIQTLNRALTFA